MKVRFGRRLHYSGGYGGIDESYERSDDGDNGTREEDEKPKSKICKGNPIDVLTGNKIQLETDYLGLGGFPLSIVRLHNTQYSNKKAADASLFGQGWVSALGYKLEVLSDSIRLHRNEERPIYLSSRTNNRNKYSDYEDNPTVVTKNAAGHYIFYSGKGKKETYNSDGTLREVESKFGIKHKYTYDTAGKLSVITHSNGRTLHFYWHNLTVGNRVSHIVDSAGNRYNYHYSNAGLLISKGTPDGNATSYHYKTEGDYTLLTGVSYNNIRYSWFEYNGKEAISTSHANNIDKFSFERTRGASDYRYGGRMPTEVIITNPLGYQCFVITTQRLDGIYNLTQLVWRVV